MQPSSISFTKMHGLGNDFVVIDTLNQSFDLSELPIPELANRHIGIGFDQLLVIERSNQADFFCRIFNSDGSEAEQCGNGLRCVARYIHEEKLCSHSSFRLATKAGIYPVHIKDYDHIRITMGAPDIKDALMTLAVSHPSASVPMSVLSIGNPHAIIRVESIQSKWPDELSSSISMHSYFPQGVNVGFMQIMNPHHIRLRTFERGAGETHACGSNACAAVVAGMINGWLKEKVDVEFRYGLLTIEWAGKEQPIDMTGPAVKVFTGHLKR